MILRDDLAFPSTYEVVALDELTNGLDVHELSHGEAAVGTDCLFEVHPRTRDAWIAAVRRGEQWPGAITAALTTPNPDAACLIARGDAYVVDTNDPAASDFVRTGGAVVAAYAIPTHDLLLLVGPSEVTAVGRDGVAWRTERLAIERVRLDEVDGDYVVGVADDDDWEPRDVMIDLKSGRHTGGVPFA